MRLVNLNSAEETNLRSDTDFKILFPLCVRTGLSVLTRVVVVNLWSELVSPVR